MGIGYDRMSIKFNKKINRIFKRAENYTNVYVIILGADNFSVEYFASEGYFYSVIIVIFIYGCLYSHQKEFS